MIVQVKMTLNVCTQIMSSSTTCIVSARAMMPNCFLHKMYLMPVCFEVRFRAVEAKINCFAFHGLINNVHTHQIRKKKIHSQNTQH